MDQVEGSHGHGGAGGALDAEQVIDLIADFERRISHLSFAEVTRGALAFMAERLGLARASVALLEADGETFRIFDTTAQDRGLESAKVVPRDTASLGVTVNRRAAIYRPDILASPARNSLDAALVAAGYRCTISVPLLCGGRCIGTLNAAEKSVDGIDLLKRRIIELVAPRMAFAIHAGVTHGELAESETRFRDVFAHVGDGMVVANVANRRIEMVNPAMCALVGRSSQELLAGTIELLHPADRLDEAIARFTAMLEGGGDHGLGMPMARADGTAFLADVAARPTMLSGRSCVVGVFRDAELRQQREQEQVQLQKLESIRTLAAGIAHDFNNLLTGLIGYMSLVRPYLEQDSEPWEMLGEAHRAAVRAAGLTRQLLSFAKGGSPVRRIVDIVPIVRESASLAAAGTNLQCQFELPTRKVLVAGDEGQLAQVIQNLVRNAAEAMPAGGIAHIKVSVARTGRIGGGEDARIEVSDTGAGIAPALFDRVFVPFFTTKPNGSGLGLAVAHSVVQNHGGRITLASVQGEGATFTILLPVTEAPEEVLAPDGAETSRTGRVLVMDDQAAIRHLAERALGGVGHETVLAADGAEAVAAYREALAAARPFDVTILDLTVPGGMGGREAAAAILAMDSKTKLVVSSGYSEDAMMSDHRSHGFLAVLPKPYDAEQLRGVVARLLRPPVA